MKDKKKIILKAKSTVLLNLCEEHFILGQGLHDAVTYCFKRAVKDNDDLRADIQNKPF